MRTLSCKSVVLVFILIAIQVSCVSVYPHCHSSLLKLLESWLTPGAKRSTHICSNRSATASSYLLQGSEACSMLVCRGTGLRIWTRCTCWGARLVWTALQACAKHWATSPLVSHPVMHGVPPQTLRTHPCSMCQQLTTFANSLQP